MLDLSKVRYMKHYEVLDRSLHTGNHRCSCGQVFSKKGLAIHMGMMNKNA